MARLGPLHLAVDHLAAQRPVPARLILAEVLDPPAAWISESHLTLATPYQPGTSSRSGDPWWRVSGSPLSAYASSGSGDIALSRGRLRPNCCSTLKFCAAELHLLLAAIGAEEHELARLRLDAGLIEHRAQRDAGPAAVAESPWSGRRLPEHSKPATSSVLFILRRSSSESDSGLSTSPETFSRNVGRIHLGMAVVLRREELVLRRERAVDRADVERRRSRGVRWMFSGRSVKGTSVSPCARAGRTHVGKAKGGKARRGETALEHVATGVMCGSASRGLPRHRLGACVKPFSWARPNASPCDGIRRHAGIVGPGCRPRESRPVGNGTSRRRPARDVVSDGRAACHPSLHTRAHRARFAREMEG